jgi:hypothetical protein
MKLRQLTLIALAAACGGVETPSGNLNSGSEALTSEPQVIWANQAVSIPVRDMKPGAFKHAPVEKPLLIPSQLGGPDVGRGSAGSFDPVVQGSATTPFGGSILFKFLGVGTGFPGFVMQGEPSDSNGAVGATQFVEWVNLQFAVFSKTGALLAGPTNGNALFANLGGPCAANNDGDPIAQYDKNADRWVLTQFSVTGGPPFFQCVAVSQTADATGAYNLYAFQFNNFNDYPKLGSWPDPSNDAYFITFNMFTHRFLGAQACGLERSQMLAGGPARAVCFQFGRQTASLLPADLDGATLPPAGTPGLLTNFGSNSLNLFKFNVNWINPLASSISSQSVAVPAFSAACNGGACIPQPSTTQNLDSLADRLMYRLAYRNFGTHESLVVNHSVNPNNSTSGVRWYELRNTPGATLAAGAPTVFQASTYAPDTNFRWMGSVAMDKVGDLAAGYSLSSGSVFPSIRITGRAPGDPLNTLRQEATVVNGIGSQQGHARWGDYSSMAIDPVDDCTFWYTQQFIDTAGVNDFIWSTQVVSFKFPTCL